CSSTSSSETSTSSTSTETPLYSGRSNSGRTSTSAVNFSCSPSANSVTSTSGRPTTSSLASWMAWPYSSGSAELIASSSTAPRPMRWSMTRGGTLPFRKPGTVTCSAILLYAVSRLGSSSAKGTSTVSRTRVGSRVSTALFTAVISSLGLLLGSKRVLGVWSRRMEALRRRQAYRDARRIALARVSYLADPGRVIKAQITTDHDGSSQVGRAPPPPIALQSAEDRPNARLATAHVDSAAKNAMKIADGIRVPSAETKSPPYTPSNSTANHIATMATAPQNCGTS